MNTTTTYFDSLINQIQTTDSTKERQKLFKIARKFYEEHPVLQTIWDFIEDARLIVDRFVRKIIKKIANKIRKIEWADGVKPIEDGHEQFYLIRCLNCDDELVWSKIGTTARNVDKRMREHLRAYKKYGVTRIIVDRVWDCGDYPAEMYESDFRAFYMRKHPGAWKKNDRFINVLFDLNEADIRFKQVGENI